MTWASLATSVHRACVGVFDHTPTDVVSVVTIGTGAALPFPAVFDLAGVRVDQDTGASISTNSPMIGATIADVPVFLDSKLHLIRVGAVDYRITDVVRDGVAGVKVYLRNAP